MSDWRERVAGLIERHEGRRMKPYTDTTGHLTVGVGRNLTSVRFSTAEVDLMLETDIDHAVADCRKLFPTFDTLSEVRQAVLADMVFNMGLVRLRKFQRMRRALRNEDFDTASLEMLDSTWAEQVGRRALRLAQMMRTDAWPATPARRATT